MFIMLFDYFQSTEGVPGPRIELGHLRSHSDARRDDHSWSGRCSKVPLDDVVICRYIIFLSAIKLLLEGDDDDEDEINDGLVMRIARREWWVRRPSMMETGSSPYNIKMGRV